MSAVPYTFANNYGNIPLSELDTNFANCKAFADTAGLVTINAQPAITSVGTLTTLSVAGNIVAANLVGNVTATTYKGTSVSVTGNITGGNIVTGGSVTATGNVDSNQMTVNTSIGLGGQLDAVGNISAGNVLTVGIVSAVGSVSTSANVISNNISAINSLRGNLIVNPPVYANITANATTYSLSTTNSLNILIANNTGYTVTLDMPAVQQNGQICQFAVHGNTMTLAAGIGNILPTFAGSATVGTSFKYVYNTSDSNWYKI
jgi:hypothetical protein